MPRAAPSPRDGPVKITEALVASLKANGERYVVRDTELRGFMVAVNQRGMSYKVQKDLWVGPKGQRKLAKTVRQTIGEVGRMSVKEARSRALVIVSKIADGRGPERYARASGDRDLDRRAHVEGVPRRHALARAGRVLDQRPRHAA